MIEVEATIDLSVLAYQQRTSLHTQQAVFDFLRFFNYRPFQPIAVFLYCPRGDCCDGTTCTYFRIVRYGAIRCYDFYAIQKYFEDMYNELLKRQLKGEKISETEVENKIISFFADFKPSTCMLAKPIFKAIKIRVSDAVIWVIKYPDELWR
jgi:hypothetical protein